LYNKAVKSQFYHVRHIDKVVNIKQVGPPIRATIVFIGADQKVPSRTRADFREHSGVEEDHHRVGWRQSKIMKKLIIDKESNEIKKGKKKQKSKDQVI